MALKIHCFFSFHILESYTMANSGLDEVIAQLCLSKFSKRCTPNTGEIRVTDPMCVVVVLGAVELFHLLNNVLLIL